jgi:hypothetical protein
MEYPLFNDSIVNLIYFGAVGVMLLFVLLLAIKKKYLLHTIVTIVALVLFMLFSSDEGMTSGFLISYLWLIWSLLRDAVNGKINFFKGIGIFLLIFLVLSTSDAPIIIGLVSMVLFFPAFLVYSIASWFTEKKQK